MSPPPHLPAGPGPGRSVLIYYGGISLMKLGRLSQPHKSPRVYACVGECGRHPSEENRMRWWLPAHRHLPVSHTLTQTRTSRHTQMCASGTHMCSSALTLTSRTAHTCIWGTGGLQGWDVGSSDAHTCTGQGPPRRVGEGSRWAGSYLQNRARRPSLPLCS